MKRHTFVMLTAGFALGALSGNVGRASADTTGTMVGTVNDLTTDHIDILVNRQVTRFALGDGFLGVFAADGKTKRLLSDVTNGASVRVTFLKSTVGTAYRKATQIDILPVDSKPLPLPKDATP